MKYDNKPLIFDVHNDLLSVLHKFGQTLNIDDFQNGLPGHLDLKKIRKGGFGGGFFAIWVSLAKDGNLRRNEMVGDSYDIPLPDPINVSEALGPAIAQASILHRLEAKGFLKICTDIQTFDDCINKEVIAAIMHIEGSEPIDPEFLNLDFFYRAGLRSIGPVWSRPNIFGHGVPFRYPSTGDVGPGLTDCGLRLVDFCDYHGMILDLSHLNEAGFWDVANRSQKPLIATHSNAYAICPHARNLSDKQLAAIAESDGMVGLNFSVAFLRPDGQMDYDTELDVMISHLDYLIEKLGEDRVGFGSDFDGTFVPEGIADASGLSNLRNSLRLHGYNEELIKKLCYKNWRRVIEKVWH